MNFIRRLNKESLYVSNQSFQIWSIISSMEVMKKFIFHLNIYKITSFRPNNMLAYVINTTTVISQNLIYLFSSIFGF